MLVGRRLALSLSRPSTALAITTRKIPTSDDGKPAAIGGAFRMKKKKEKGTTDDRDNTGATSATLEKVLTAMTAKRPRRVLTEAERVYEKALVSMYSQEMNKLKTAKVKDFKIKEQLQKEAIEAMPKHLREIMEAEVEKNDLPYYHYYIPTDFPPNPKFNPNKVE
eukprot:TRINITY_DN16351_c0_g1_i1.p1 TRINITY_DN16351_c0_g1~~TRINITY_DN16351_c0_g1_i1.p1  ORF type:complete len:183 (-),score=56.85 TRINITY_DN16351_c0_g1_i1:161-655(-)